MVGERKGSYQQAWKLRSGNLLEMTVLSHCPEDTATCTEEIHTRPPSKPTLEITIRQRLQMNASVSDVMEWIHRSSLTDIMTDMLPAMVTHLCLIQLTKLCTSTLLKS